MNAVIGFNPFRRRTQPTVRVQLPTSMGRSISVGGLEFAADDEGFVSMPENMAAELEAHLPKEPISTGMHASVELASIAKIDGEIRELTTQKLALEAARAAAYAMKDASSDATAELAELAEKKRGTAAGFFFGTHRREDLAEIEQQRSKAAARAEKDRQSRELGALGVDAINSRIEPIDQSLLALQAARSLAVRRAVRARAEKAAHEYLDHMQATARAFGVVDAYGQVLAQLERVGTGREDTAGGRQSFGFYNWREIGPLPGFPALEAFAGRGPNVSLSFNAAELRDHVRQLLRTDGILP